MSRTTPRAYAGRSADQRREERRAALLEAALELLAEEGYDAVTVRAVCGRARLNDRYFGESFRDRDDLLATLLREVATSGVAHVLEALERVDTDLRTQVRTTVTAGLEHFTADPRRPSVLVHSQASAELRRVRHEVVRMLCGVMVTRQRDLLGPQAPAEQDAELTAFTLVSGILELLAAWAQGELETTADHLSDFVVAMLLTSSDISVALDREQRAHAKT